MHSPFNFENHRRDAIEAYRRTRDTYAQFAEGVRFILRAALDAEAVTYLSIEARAKDLDSFGDKAAKALETDPTRPKYADPLKQITDMSGVRVITFVPGELDKIDHAINSEFIVVEKTDKSEELMESDRFGYKSIHYLVRLRPERESLPEYRRFAGLLAEVQTRTILQHAWAELEHDIRYKSVIVIPNTIRRRFAALAGLLEIADREFQAIQDEDERLRLAARESVAAGDLTGIEITPDALKSYLNRAFGPDRRVAQFSYEMLARDLRFLGFNTIEEVDNCIEGYDNDQISRTIWGSRQGQITRFENTLLAAMGENFTKLHRWQNNEFWTQWHAERLAILRMAGIEIGSFMPSTPSRLSSQE